MKYSLRSHVKFLGVIDLDELIHVPSGRNPIDVFETLANAYPDAANFALDWQYVQDEVRRWKKIERSRSNYRRILARLSNHLIFILEHFDI